VLYSNTEQSFVLTKRVHLLRVLSI